jgi:hypothetical protein
LSSCWVPCSLRKRRRSSPPRCSPSEGGQRAGAALVAADRPSVTRMRSALEPCYASTACHCIGTAAQMAVNPHGGERSRERHCDYHAAARQKNTRVRQPPN